jgi:CBS domain-containing protein
VVRDPILNSIYVGREFFDFHVVCGDPAPGLELKEIILAELKRNEAFIPVLANDTLANLPPLTFFQGFVIEADGARKQALDLEKTVLNPIVDAARVFALAGGEVSAANTLLRLESAARRGLFMHLSSMTRLMVCVSRLTRMQARDSSSKAKRA